MKQANCCADPFSVHKKKVVSMLRVVSETVRLQHPKLLLEKDDKLCTNYRTKVQQLQDSTSSSASQDEGVMVLKMLTMKMLVIFQSPFRNTNWVCSMNHLNLWSKHQSAKGNWKVSSTHAKNYNEFQLSSQET